MHTDGVIPRRYTPGNDYLIDRDVQRNSTFSGVPDVVSQDLIATELMHPIYDRTQERPGSTDLAVTRIRPILLRTARHLAKGKEPPAVAGDQGYRSIRGAEKILEPGEDWRILGISDDPAVREAMGASGLAGVTD